MFMTSPRIPLFLSNTAFQVCQHCSAAKCHEGDVEDP